MSEDRIEKTQSEFHEMKKIGLVVNMEPHILQKMHDEGFDPYQELSDILYNTHLEIVKDDHPEIHDQQELAKLVSESMAAKDTDDGRGVKDKIDDRLKPYRPGKEVSQRYIDSIFCTIDMIEKLIVEGEGKLLIGPLLMKFLQQIRDYSWEHSDMTERLDGIFAAVIVGHPDYQEIFGIECELTKQFKKGNIYSKFLEL